MSKFAISPTFYSPSHTRAPRTIARRHGRESGSTMQKKGISALTVIGSAAAVSYAEAKWGLPAIKFSQDDKSVLNHFGTSDFLGGVAILGLSLWGKIPAAYDGIAQDVAKGTLAHWASVTVFNSVAPGTDVKPSHPVTRGMVAGRMNAAAGRRAYTPEQVWQGQFARR